MKRRVLLIYLSPLLIILPILWVFVPHWAWKTQGHDLASITFQDIEWENTPLEEAIADINAKFAAKGSKLRLEIRPAHLKNLQSVEEVFPFPIHRDQITWAPGRISGPDLLLSFGETTASSYYPTGPNTLRVDSQNLRDWPLRAQCWGYGVSRIRQVQSQSSGLDSDPSYHWVLLVN